jgi:NDP-sugar pyrophosphorylase family protein
MTDGRYPTSMKKFNVFILAAGYGERLRPVTDHIPKPLIPILGSPALERILNRFRHARFEKIGVNLHHRAELIREWIEARADRRRIHLFEERDILGTGGALKNAESLLREGPFVVHNGDIISDIDIHALTDYHASSGNLVTLAIHDMPEFNNVYLDDDGELVSVGKSETGAKAAAFTGIAVYGPRFLDYLPEGKCSVIDGWLKAVSNGERIGAFRADGSFWADIGTPASFAATVFSLLKRDGETVHIDESFESCGSSEILGNVVIEHGCSIGGSYSLRNCILLPGTTVNPGASAMIENCIMGPGFEVAFLERDVFPADENGVRSAGEGGSGRQYFRINRGGKSFILMRCEATDSDYDRHIDYTRFFRRNGVPVPELLEADRANVSALFEDAGDISLYSWLRCPRTEAEKESVFRMVMDALVSIHSISPGDAGSLFRIFDYDYFRWETGYFMRRFVGDFMGIETAGDEVIEEDLHRLAEVASSFTVRIIHRDFQSQNVMVMPGGDLRIIDFQGARLGPPAYDVVSILYDPYYRLDDDLRTRLLDYYVSRIIGCGMELDRDEFDNSLLPCRLQRHMQALGAYAYLSDVKGKVYFRKFMPEGLRLLKEDIESVRSDYPGLYRLIGSLSLR